MAVCSACALCVRCVRVCTGVYGCVRVCLASQVIDPCAFSLLHLSLSLSLRRRRRRRRRTGSAPSSSFSSTLSLINFQANFAAIIKLNCIQFNSIQFNRISVDFNDAVKGQPAVDSTPLPSQHEKQKSSAEKHVGHVINLSTHRAAAFQYFNDL